MSHAPQEEERGSGALGGPALAPFGVVIGLVASMCGIGGGLFAVPVLHYGARLPLRTSVASALVLVLCTAVSATVTEAARADSELRWGLIGALVVGALLGAQLGYAISRRIRTHVLKGVFVVVLALVGARIVFADAPPPLGVGQHQEPGPLEYAVGLFAGVGGGIAAPLLGIGGGLVFVPAVAFALPYVGFAGARACSLATAVVTAARSVWLYSRERHVAWRPALWLGGGALAGAILGVTLVHAPGWIDVARRSLGVVFWIVSARFAWDVARASAARRAG